MLSMSEINVGTKVTISDQPFEVIKAAHSKQARGGAVLKLKLRNIIDGSILEKTIQGSESLEPADLGHKKVQFLYDQGGELAFMDQETYETISFRPEQIGEKKQYLKEGLEVEAMYFNNSPVSIDLPIKMEFEVVEAPPGIKGDTAQGGTKQVKIETGLMVTAPLFIKEGEKIVVDTRDGSYVERA